MRLPRTFLFGLFTGGLITGVMLILVLRQSGYRPMETVTYEQADVTDPRQILLDSLLQTQQSALLANILDLIDADLRANPSRSLRPETIDRIAAFCYGAGPYLKLETDSLGTPSYSPERGQLLLSLARMNLDSLSWQQVKVKASFARSYLPNADLAGTDLRGVDLRGAWLRDADLRGTDLSAANLKEARLWGAQMEQARLHQADLTRAVLSWSDLRRADMRATILSGGHLVAAQMNDSDLQGAWIQWVDAESVVLDGANLTASDLSGTNLYHARLTGARLDSANLTHTKFMDTGLKGASLRGVRLDRTAVPDAHWFDLLKSWQVAGVEDLESAHIFVDERPRGRPQHIIMKKKD